MADWDRCPGCGRYMDGEERQHGACTRCQAIDADLAAAREKTRWDTAVERSQRWATEVEAALKQAGLGPVTIEPSNVQGSPHQYVYIWPAGIEEDPRFIISEESEYEEGGTYYLVGQHKEGDGSNVELIPTLEEAVTRTKELIDDAKRSN